MREKHREKKESKGICYEALEEFAREKIREHLQYLLEEEVTEWLGREKSERKGNASEQPGYRNGYGKRRRFALSTGTVDIRRPRVRDLGERFISKVLPFFKRQTKQVRDLILELYLHGLASGDFELALRGLLGEGTPPNLFTHLLTTAPQKTSYRCGHNLLPATLWELSRYVMKRSRLDRSSSNS